MRDFLLAVAVFATIATSLAVDEECIIRKIRGLPVHWPNPTDCTTFFRCTNKNIKRELLCPTGKEYNPATGRCGPQGMGLCRLSLAAPLALTVDVSCVGKISGTFMPDQSSCGSFFLCNDNTSYPQNCDPGSYFNTELSACAPDTKTECWENLCVNKTNGSFVADAKDCHAFYICDKEKPIAQKCNETSYFNAENLICQPGKCPSEETTTTVTDATTDTTSTETETTTTAITSEKTTTGATEATTKACTDTTTTTTCAPETTTTTCVSITTTTCKPTTATTKTTRAPRTTSITTTTCAPTTTTTCEPTTTTTRSPRAPRTTKTTTTTCAPTTTTTTTCAPSTTTTRAPKTTTTRAPRTVTTTTTTTCAPTTTTTTTCAPITTTTRAPRTVATTTTTCEPTTTTTTCAPTTTTTTCAPTTTTRTTHAPKTTTTHAPRTIKTTTTTTTCTTTTDCISETTTTTCSPEETTTLADDCSSNKCDRAKCSNVKNGYVFPAQNTSAGFCVCLDKNAEYHECPNGAKFNQTLNICLSDNKVCPSYKCNSLPDFSTFPASNTTHGFCRCLSGQASFFECAGNDFVYDNVLGFCTGANKTTDCPESKNLCKGGYAEGDFVPDPDNCMLFYICYEGELEEVNCDQGNYFDNEVKACLPDTDNNCPACHQAQTFLNNRRHKRDIRFSTCPEGAKTPADGCDKYYKCSKGHKLLYGCGKDNFFNITTLTCQLDVQHVCWPVNTCTNGDRNPYPEDNTKYYECVNGKQEIKSCDSQSIFNKLTKSCIARQECTCPGGYKEGELSAHPSDCDKFYICSEGEQVMQECGKGNYFNPETLCCEKDVDHVCHAKDTCLCPGGYEEGELSAHPTDCDKYYICEDGKQVLQECGKDNYFDKDTSSCEPDIYGECWNKKACTCPGGYKEGDFSAHPTDCNKYYICHDSQQVLEDCGVNNYFNNDTLTCEPDVYHVCWPNLCAGQANGALVSNPQQCNSFFLCENDEAIPKACYEGQWFDASSGACVADLKAVCYNPCANESAGPVVLLPHPICNEYYFCNGHKTFVGTCLVGSFDIETGVCNENKKCFPNPCNKPNTTTFADPYDPKKFYWCNAEKRPIPADCPEEMEFNADLGVCKKYSDPDCEVCKKDGSFPTLDDSNDSDFCVCVDGIATKIECSQGYVFNEALGVCYSNAPCDPSFCLDAKEYATAPNRNNSKSFCMCFNNKAIIIDCPNNGTFNPYTLECSDYEISPQCLQSTCVGKTNNNYVFKPINLKTSNGFCQCINQIATFKPCSYGSTFNPDLMICQLAEINCNSYQCRNLPDKTIMPSVSTTEGYCVCNNGVAIFHNCPNYGEFNATTNECEAPLCDLSQCASTKATKYPFPASKPDGFCLCNVGFVPCETDGTLYSETFGSCLDPCPQTSCEGKPDKYLVSSPLNNYSFCVCHTYPRAGATYELCPSESFLFEEKDQLCVPNSEELCGLTCTEAGAFEANDTLTGFCLCTAKGKKPTFSKCPSGVFVPEFSACMPTAQDVCNVCLCAEATIEHPITMPANNSITQFCYCSSPTNVMLLPCPDGKYYSIDKGMCISQQEKNCKCPSNVGEGGKIADSASCNKYSICIRGVMESHTCPDGQYFNVDINDCCVDTKGVCSKQSSCTCLGIYYENELLPHPVNPQMYYACQGNTLHEYRCQLGRVFSATQKQCISSSNSRQKRSLIDVSNDHEFGCLENEKRSVPSNCSQYEICLQQMWQLQTCSNFHYYNPEEKKCLEPRDDFVCSYAKVTSLPTCNASLEYYLLKAKNCQHYYRCESGKWRLKSCGRQKYFNAKVNSCLAKPEDAAFKCDLNGDLSKSEEQITEPCQHLSQRFYDQNCAMYLICLDNNWYYQYCPPGMLYNRSLNFCVKDAHQQCKDVVKSEVKLETEEFSVGLCLQDGLLRPSALACNRYFVCFNGKWQMQHCSTGEYYDVANAQCAVDLLGLCDILKKDCLVDERKPVARNCSSYEQCSQDGKWLLKSCPAGESYDDLLQQCITNNGICSKHGLKRTCRESEKLRIHQNCSMFYYCYQDSWQLGSCLKGFMFSEEKKTCVAHLLENKCKPLHVKKPPANDKNFYQNPCFKKVDGTWVSHANDCSRYYVCVQQNTYQEMQCSRGTYFDTSLGYCRANDGSCRLPLTGICSNASEGSLVAHPSDCQAFYSCSSINGTELQYCPTNQYFDKILKQCRVDKGECKKEIITKQKCSSLEHGKLLAHETYCNIYYACVKGLAISVECPANQRFDSVLGKCVLAKDNDCQTGHLKENKITESCNNLTDGTFLADREDCTRYYICSEGEALHKKCSNSSYFDNEQLLCMPDDGSCPFVYQESKKNQTAPPDPLQCEGKHGFLMADPLNCHGFYVCIHNKLKHERCYAQQFFNSTLKQCQQNIFSETLTNNSSILSNESTLIAFQCLDETLSLKKLCSEMTEGSSLAEPGDCRRFLTCQESEEEPLTQRCRNGESYDTLLGFCRQNDGTCLLENGQRVGECSGKHGQLIRDTSNCRDYFVCINGQKIQKTCEDGQFFSKSQNMCIKDTQYVCKPNRNPEELTMQSCAGLSESILYPYLPDNCRSYFQCIEGIAKVHKCADDLYFDPLAIKCVKNKTECIMPTQTLQRSPAFSQTFNKLCLNKEFEYPYANFANNCYSFYMCHENGTLTHELCPLGMMFSPENNICVNENQTLCTTS